MYYPHSSENVREYLINAPIKVRMAGFSSDTQSLQSSGWQISAEQLRLPHANQVEQRIIFKHEGIKQYAMGLMVFSPFALMGGGQHAMNHLREIGIDINVISPMIQFQVFSTNVSAIGDFRFLPVGGSPQFVNVSIEDIAIFKPINVHDQFDVIINQKDEEDLMKIILAKQDIKQAEIRQRLKRDAFRMGTSGYESRDLVDRQNLDIKCNIIVAA